MRAVDYLRAAAVPALCLWPLFALGALAVGRRWFDRWMRKRRGC